MSIAWQWKIEATRPGTTNASGFERMNPTQITKFHREWRVLKDSAVCHVTIVHGGITSYCVLNSRALTHYITSAWEIYKRVRNF